MKVDLSMNEPKIFMVIIYKKLELISYLNILFFKNWTHLYVIHTELMLL